MEAIEILKKFSDHFIQWSFESEVGRDLAWVIICLLYNIANLTEKLLDTVYTMGGILEDEQVQTLVDAIMPIAWALMAVSVLYYGYKVMTGKQELKQDLMINIMLIASLFILLPWAIQKLNTATEKMYKYSKTIYAPQTKTEEDSSLALSIVQNNTVDLIWLSNAKWELNATGQSNFINSDNMLWLDPNERIHPEGKFGTDYKLKGKNKEVFSKVRVIDGEGKESLQDISVPDFPLVGKIEEYGKYYYRYSVNFWAVIIQLGIIAIAFLATSYKVVRLILEIGFSKVLSPFIASTDLSTGQRTKELIKNIVMNYSALFLIPLVMQFYLLCNAWLTLQDYNWIIKTIIMIAFGMFLIDGPDIAKKLLGVDLGVQDGWRAMMGTWAGMSMLSKPAGALAKGGKKALDKLNNSNGNNQEQLENLDHNKMKNQDIKNKLDSELESNEVGAVGINSAGNALEQAINKDGTIGEASNVNSTSNDNNSGMISSENKINEEQEQKVKQLLEQNDMKPEDVERTVKNVLEDINNSAQNQDRNVHSLINGDLDNTTAQRLINDISSGTNDVESTQRQINDILENNDLSPENKQRLINDLINNDSGNSVNRLINDITNGEGNLENKQRMVNELLQGDNLTDYHKNRLINELTNGQGNTEVKQRMVQDLMNNGSINDATKKQVVENIMNSKDLSVGQKTQMLNTITSDLGGNESKQRLINDIVSGNASNDLKQNVIQDVVSKGNNNATQRVTAVQDILNSGGDSVSKTRQISEVISRSAGDISTQSRMINEVLNHPGSDLSTKSQMINTMINQNDLNPRAKQQLINQVVSSNGMPIETKQAYINQVMQQQGTNLETKTQMIRGMFETNGGTLAPQVQQVSQMMTSNTLNPEAKNIMVNEMFKNSQMPENRKNVIVETLLNGSGTLSNQRQVVEQIINKQSPVVDNRKQFIEQVKGSQLDSSIVRQITNPTYTPTPKVLTQHINQVMNNSELSSEFKNNVINELMSPHSVYRAEKNTVENKLDYLNL
ncbi:hypothetical protein RW115_12000 [Macrococcus capreoli]